MSYTDLGGVPMDPGGNRFDRVGLLFSGKTPPVSISHARFHRLRCQMF
jgi:hypothetical protein